MARMATRFTAWLEEPWTAGQAIVYGALAVGVLDGLAAIISMGLRGAGPLRPFQGIASGLLGRDAFSGGAATAFLGLALHFVVALGVASTYLAASRIAPALVQRPLLFGVLYGIAVFFVMNYAVIPLSVIGRVVVRWPSAIEGVLIHALIVGPPAAIAAAKAYAGRAPVASESPASPLVSSSSGPASRP
jgi:hypothetical protein